MLQTFMKDYILDVVPFSNYFTYCNITHKNGGDIFSFMTFLIKRYQTK